MRLFYVLGLFCLPAIVSAYLTVETDVSQPYEVVPVEVTAPAQVSFLGTLIDYPVMYEVSSEEPFTFSAQLWQSGRSDIQSLSLLLIRKNDRGGGVSEVARMNVNPEEWESSKDSVLGMSFLASPVIAETVEPGTYRIEVSSPDNQGKYLLQIGEESADLGYLETLSSVRQTQQYFGYSFFSMLKSSYVYYPLGIILLLFAFYKTWQFSRKHRVHV
jgi:hypothetical protein